MWFKVSCQQLHLRLGTPLWPSRLPRAKMMTCAAVLSRLPVKARPPRRALALQRTPDNQYASSGGDAATLPQSVRLLVSWSVALLRAPLRECESDHLRDRFSLLGCANPRLRLESPTATSAALRTRLVHPHGIVVPVAVANAAATAQWCCCRHCNFRAIQCAVAASVVPAAGPHRAINPSLIDRSVAQVPLARY